MTMSLLVVVGYLFVLLGYLSHPKQILASLTDSDLEVSLAVSKKTRMHLLQMCNASSDHATKGATLRIPLRPKGHGTPIGIGCAVTSFGMKSITAQNMQRRLPFLKSLLPSFCDTMSSGYHYHFYLAYDFSDRLFRRRKIKEAFHRVFNNYTAKHCIKDDTTSVHLRFVKCNHKRKPARAQNDAMMQAYLDGMEYFHRINDDTRINSPHWTNIYIKELTLMDPPNVGVVGPFQGKKTLTYDFVHRTHMDIFGFYYPRFFTDWWADDWITEVYLPKRSKQLEQIEVEHTMQLGQRYKVDFRKRQFTLEQLERDKLTLLRFAIVMFHDVILISHSS